MTSRRTRHTRPAKAGSFWLARYLMVAAKTTVVVGVASLVVSACTGGEPSPSTTSVEPSTESGPPTAGVDPAGPDGPATIVEPDVLADFGVNLESATVRVGVVAASGAALDGHRAYWERLFVDSGGVGGELGVEVVELASIDGAADQDVVGVSLDQGPVVAPPDGLFAMAPEQTVEAVEAGRTLDVTRPSFGRVVAAASALAADPSFEGAGELGVAAGSSCAFDPMTYQLTAGGEAPFVLVCGTPEEAAPIVAEIDGVALLWASSWDPALFADFTGYVVGARPEPGPDVPGVDLLAAGMGGTPWDPAFVDGYTAALTTHLVLERAFAQGDVTRTNLARLAADLAVNPPGVGFGRPGEVRVGVVDPTSPTGLRTERIVEP